jgi:hypothetical protein
MLEASVRRASQALFAGSLYSRVRPHLKRVEAEVFNLVNPPLVQVDQRAWEESWKSQTVEISTLLKSFKASVRSVTSGE